MAGDWIKWTRGLTRKPEVMRLSALLGRTRQEVAGYLMEVWEWADDVCALSPTDGDTTTTSDSNDDAEVVLGNTPAAHVDALIGVPGFAEAMSAVGWLKLRNGSLVFPNYFRHNGLTAKTRARNSSNQAARRSSKLSPSRGDKTVTREEKRREEKETTVKSGPPPPKRFQQPTVEEVAAYCRERGNSIDPQRFVDYYAANGWRVGKNPMKDWRAAVRTWEKNDRERRASGGGHRPANRDEYIMSQIAEATADD